MTESEQKAYLSGVLDSNSRYRQTILMANSLVQLTIDAVKSSPIELKEIRDQVDRMALEVVKLIDEDINRTKHYQTALELLIDSCLSCPAGHVCAQTPENRESCREAIVSIIEEKVKAGRVDG